KMLGTGSSFHIPGIVSLQAFNKADTQTAGQIRILSIGLLAPTPTGIPEDVYIGSPESESLVDTPIFVFPGRIVFCSGFISNGRSHIIQSVRAESGSHTDGLWENCGCSCPGYSMETFIPPVIFMNIQSSDSS